MTALQKTPRRRRRHWREAIGLAVVLTLFVLAGVHVISRQHVHRVTLAPGESQEIRITARMQRTARSMSFAMDLSLPVECTIETPRPQAGGVRVEVLATGHRVHEMWADVRVSAYHSATPGRREFELDFRINEVDDWPRAALVVNVEKN